MAPAAVVQEHPKRICAEAAEVERDADHHLLHLFLHHAARKVMMIDEVVSFLGAEHRGKDVATEELGLVAA
jgi:hypothetical protein